jgi:hypothetical protein
MWQCSNCGERVENQFELCWNCQAEKGDSIPYTLIAEEPRSWECDACGAEVAADDNTCLSCGADISQIAGPQLFCPKCGSRVDDDAEFCSSCAARISASDVNDCPNCGKSVNAEARFCKYCAANLTRAPKTSDFANISDHTIAKRLASKQVTSSMKSFANTSKQGSQNGAAGNLIVFGILLAVVSAIAYFWGVNYAGNFSNAMAAGLENLVGRRDQTYDIAIMATQFGPFGFFSALILFVVGLVLKHR